MAKRILVDTHVWLWMNGSPERLSETARRQLSDAETALFLSAASVWEISIKTAGGKLELPEPPERYIIPRLAANRIDALPIRPLHAIRAAALPMHHRDPFDRMLVAQAQLEELELMTGDAALRRYEVETLRA
ncbi:MAG: type II toxin-antitoxin system VapC family toxin [Acidobacteriota bacterium]